MGTRRVAGFVSVALLALAGLNGCASTKPPKLAPDASKQTLEQLPEWMITLPEDPSFIFASGSGVSQDLQLAMDKAKTVAQRGLAEQLGTKINAMTKQFQEETGMAEGSALLQQYTTATKQVTSQTLVGASVKERKLLTERGMYRAYVLMQVPLGQANKLLMDKIKANQELYTQFRATKTFEELDKAVQEMDSAK